MKKYILIGCLLSTLAGANETIVNSVGINLGVSQFDYKQENTNGSIELSNSPDNTLGAIEIYTHLNPFTEFCRKHTLNPYISYTYASNTDFQHQYLLIGLNKAYLISQSTIDIGLVAGYGELKWKYNPLNNSKNNDYTASEPVVGMNLGWYYPLSKQLSTGIDLKVLYHDYKAFLNPSNSATATLKHKFSFNTSVGLKWRF